MALSVRSRLTTSLPSMMMANMAATAKASSRVQNFDTNMRPLSKKQLHLASGFSGGASVLPVDSSLSSSLNSLPWRSAMANELLCIHAPL